MIRKQTSYSYFKPAFPQHILPMATSSGLMRRRGGGTAASADEDSAGRVASPAPKRNDDKVSETLYESSENGHKIAFDPRDMSESAERSKQPVLTLMEEVLLMGLKDKQASGSDIEVMA